MSSHERRKLYATCDTYASVTLTVPTLTDSRRMTAHRASHYSVHPTCNTIRSVYAEGLSVANEVRDTELMHRALPRVGPQSECIRHHTLL